MSTRYGVMCASRLGHPIPLETIDDDPKGKMTFYAVPLNPILCPDCGWSAVYGSENAIEFELEDTIPNVRVPD